ncbi:MAG: hypothetical protein A2W26_06820 [Acidobacteria bacterium RBG_16_64_8]|nr:MAG: hypothetical protein A2W26_06820 [Acidobacteria bacterium RBG_16_64_8]
MPVTTGEDPKTVDVAAHLWLHRWGRAGAAPEAPEGGRQAPHPISRLSPGSGNKQDLSGGLA